MTACRILSARRYSADCAVHGRFGIDEYQQSPICPGQEGLMSHLSTEPRERMAARRLEYDRAREANTYVPRPKPLAPWQRVSPELAVVALLVLGLVVVSVAWAGRAWGF